MNTVQSTSQSHEWLDLTRRASLASHKLIGWIFWDPTARDNLASLGVPDGMGHYITNRAAPIAAAGPEVVTAVFFSIKREFVEFSLGHAAPHVSDWRDVTRARDAAVRTGLERMTPEIIEPLGALANDLWNVVDALPVEGRALFAAHKAWPRPDDPVLSSWNALNTIREWRGDTHWAIIVNEGLDLVEAGLLHDAWMGYPQQWIPRSRGADDDQINRALASLAARGLASSTEVNDAGVEYRQELEDRTDRLSSVPWKLLGENLTRRLLAIVEPVAEKYLDHINNTAGDYWMPAARPRRR